MPPSSKGKAKLATAPVKKTMIKQGLPQAKGTAPTSDDWMKVLAKYCGACKQSTHDFEKDLLPKKILLKWLHSDWSAKQNTMVPSGRFCHWCIDTRRRFFSDEWDNLLMIKDKQPEVESKFSEFRKDRVTGAGEFADQEKTSTTYYLTEKETDFEEGFVTATFTEFFKFLHLRSLQPPRDTPREELVKLVMQLCPSASCELDKRG